MEDRKSFDGVEEGFFLGDGGTRLFYRYFDPGNARQTLIVLHGHGEHSGRYQKFFHHLSGLALSVGVFDFRGHGQSEGAEVSIHCYEQYFQDVSRFIEFLREKHHIALPIVLLGHSAGGLMALLWAQRNAHQVAKLILSAPLLGIHVPQPAVWFNALMNRICPHFVYLNPIYPPYLSHDGEEISRYRSDPYIKRKISVRLVSEMLSYASQLARSQGLTVPFPVCCLLAGDERIVDNSKTRSFLERLKAPSLRIETFPGFYHEIFNEVGQESVFQILRDVLVG